MLRKAGAPGCAPRPSSHAGTLVARTTIYITRHGLSEHNLVTHLYMGRSPHARLVEQGREQARHLGRRLARITRLERIVSSSLPRTLETAEIIAEAVGLPEVEHEEGFWELSKGEWEGRMPRHLPRELADTLAADPFGYRYPGGESYADVAQRAGAAFDRWVADNAGRTLLFVLHGDVIRAVLWHLLRFPPEKIGDFVTDPCSLTEFYLENGRHHLVRYNDDSHLGGPDSPAVEALR